MPRVPHESLPNGGGRLANVVKKTTKNIYIYAIFFVLVIELSSIKLSLLENYATYLYPLLTQLILSLLVYTIAYKGGKYCKRKKLALYSLCAYYGLGFFSVLFQIPDTIYSYIVTNGLLLISLILFLFSVKRNE